MKTPGPSEAYLAESETDPSAEINHELIREASALSKGVFGILPEEFYLPPNHKIEENDSCLEDDDSFKFELERVLDGLKEDDRVFVIERLGLAHAIHTVPALLRHDIDAYAAQIPPSENRSGIDRDMYGFVRNANVWLRNKEEITNEKNRLAENGKENLKGMALLIDAHADIEDREGSLDRFFPSIEALQDLGITKVIFLDEASPDATIVQQARIDNPAEDGDASHVFGFLRMYKTAGMDVSAHGIDTRENPNHELVRELIGDQIRESNEDSIREMQEEEAGQP